MTPQPGPGVDPQAGVAAYGSLLRLPPGRGGDEGEPGAAGAEAPHPLDEVGGDPEHEVGPRATTRSRPA